MTRIEDRLTRAAEELRRTVDEQVDTDAALRDVTARPAPRARRRPLIGVAAAVVAVALLGGGLAIAFGDDESQLVADGGGRGSVVDDASALQYIIETMGDNGSGPFYGGPRLRSLDELLPNVTYEYPDGSASAMTDLVVVGRVTSVEPGLGFLVPGGDAPSGIPTDFEDPESVWRNIRLQVEVDRSLGGVESPKQVEVGLAYYEDPADLERTERGLQALGRSVFFLVSESPVFDDTPGVHAVFQHWGDFIAPVDRSGTLSLPLLGDDYEQELLERAPVLDALVDAGESGPRRLIVGDDSSVQDPPPTPGGLPTPDGPDLAPADPGSEITFEGVDDVRFGQVVAPGEVQPHEGGTCGYWGPAEPTHDGDEPLGGLVDGAGTASPTVLSIQVRNDRYRTASGVGVGTTLATLQRIHGDDLVVDRADGWETPTDGLLASYQDVAAVRSGDRALTFGLRDDVVEWVKLSGAGFWGDHEGCA